MHKRARNHELLVLVAINNKWFDRRSISRKYWLDNNYKGIYLYKPQGKRLN